MATTDASRAALFMTTPDSPVCGPVMDTTLIDPMFPESQVAKDRVRTIERKAASPVRLGLPGRPFRLR